MSNKILKIEEDIPKSTTLPNGTYTGTWGGSVIMVYTNDKVYKLTTEEGVRGMNIAVVVTIHGESMTFTQINN